MALAEGPELGGWRSGCSYREPGSASGGVADRWREAKLRGAMASLGIPARELKVRGMGFQDGGKDLRAFRRACETRKVKPLPSLLLLHHQLSLAPHHLHRLRQPFPHHTRAQDVETIDHRLERSQVRVQSFFSGFVRARKPNSRGEASGCLNVTDAECALPGQRQLGPIDLG